MEIVLLPTTVDCNLDLSVALRRAAKTDNVMLIDPHLTNSNFPRQVVGIWEVEFGMAPIMGKETWNEAAERLLSNGYELKNLRSLVAFVEQHPDELEKFGEVGAIGVSSRVRLIGRRLQVPVAKIAENGRRTFSLRDFDKPCPYGALGGILVSKPRPLDPVKADRSTTLRLL